MRLPGPDRRGVTLISVITVSQIVHGISGPALIPVTDQAPLEEIMSPEAMWNMTLNETKTIGKMDIIRVPGGWIYRLFESSPTAVFVPLDNELVSRSNGVANNKLEPTRE